MDINCQHCPNCGGKLLTEISQMKKICTFCDGEFFITASAGENSQAGKTSLPGRTYAVLAGQIANKVKLIKVYRELTGLGLKEAKDKVDMMPGVLFSGLDEDTALHHVEAIKRDAQEQNIRMEAE